AFAGLAFWFHPTGLAVPLIGVVVLFVMSGSRDAWRRAAVLLVIAFCVALPPAVQRASAFGGPLAFGQNTRFFVEHDDDLWAADAASPSVGDYIRTHSTMQVIDRLIARGAGRELAHFAVSVVHLPVVPFLLAGCVVALRDPRQRPLLAATALFLLAW